MVVTPYQICAGVAPRLYFRRKKSRGVSLSRFQKDEARFVALLATVAGGESSNPLSKTGLSFLQVSFFVFDVSAHQDFPVLHQQQNLTSVIRHLCLLAAKEKIVPLCHYSTVTVTIIS